MIAFKLLLFLLFVLGWFISYRRNNDLFSPIKMYIYYSVFFYFSIYFTEVSNLTISIYLILLLSILSLIPLESTLSKGGNPQSVFSSEVSKWNYIVLWALTIPGIVVKILFIYEAGGVTNYVALLAFRVLNWQGQGHLLVFLGMIPVLSLLHFNLIIRDRAASWLRWSFFIIHFTVFIIIGLLMGSRSFIAIPLLGYLLSYSYFKRRVTFKGAAVFFVFIVMLAGILGSLRNDFGSSDKAGLLSKPSSFELAHFSYGVNPLEIIFASDDHPMLNGESYLSIFTNIIPRSVFEDKLQTGGISFTKYYKNDQWGGMSNLAPSAVGEGIMNFGLTLGIVVGVFLTVFIMIAGILFYNYFIRFLRFVDQASFWVSAKVAAIFVLYYYFILLAARFSFAEFTNVFFSYLIYSFVPVALFLVLNLFSLSNIYGTQNRVNR